MGTPAIHANAKVTREDWLNAAREVLISDGVGEVKIMALGARLGVSRSSFYWYFESRQDLLDALLDAWEVRNTALCGIAARDRPRRSRGRSATSSNVSSTRTCSIPASISRCGNGRGGMSRCAPASMPQTRRGSTRSRRCLHDTDMNRPRPTSGRAYCIFNSWAITRWISGSRWTAALRGSRDTSRDSPACAPEPEAVERLAAFAREKLG
jgi:AcrR family transcriptional regulator